MTTQTKDSLTPAEHLELSASYQQAARDAQRRGDWDEARRLHRLDREHYAAGQQALVGHGTTNHR